MIWVLGAVLVLVAIFLLSIPALLHNCAPNEVLIFSGIKRRVGSMLVGYRIVKGGTSMRKPFFERVDKMDLTNMVIDVSAQNAYCKGGIPLTVQGVANVKIAGHEPVLNNAIERFLGRNRMEIMQIAKATLEGSLRGVLATMTPQEVNEDKILFAERLVHEVEQDMTSLGLVVDTMKIQNVHDEVKYLDSIGRKRSAEVVSQARIAEAKARADSVVREAENLERETQAQITAQTEIAKADAQKRLTDVVTRRAALVAEEQSIVAAQVAQAKAEVEVQKARVEQIRNKLDADVIQPAKANAEAAEAAAKAQVAGIVEQGRARSEALRALAESWRKAGPNAREVLLVQKLNPIIEAITKTIAETNVEKVTMIDSRGSGGFPMKALTANEQIKEIFGVDLVEKVKQFGNGGKEPIPVVEHRTPEPVRVERPVEPALQAETPSSRQEKSVMKFMDKPAAAPPVQEKKPTFES